jgi:hypothetical protein
MKRLCIETSSVSTHNRFEIIDEYIIRFAQVLKSESSKLLEVEATWLEKDVIVVIAWIDVLNPYKVAMFKSNTEKYLTKLD